MRLQEIAAVAFSAGVFGAAGLLVPSAPVPTTDTTPVWKGQTRVAERAADGRALGLPRRELIGKQRGELFARRSWARQSPPPVAPSQAAAEPISLPGIPYRVAGRALIDGVAHIVLAKGDRVLPVRQGETLGDGYRVESIDPDQVSLLYEPLGIRQRLATRRAGPQFTVGVPRSAQLSWEGPRIVRSGEEFDVALKITSPKPLRASPLHLSFDAALLQPVDVRPGAYFTAGSFKYRTSGSGSIFVGASGLGGTAEDAELVVVTLKPIRAAATAELKVSSVQLEGPGGHAIPYGQPAAFRTAILE